MGCLKWERHLSPPNAGHIGTLKSQSQGVVYTSTLNKVKQNKIPLLAFIRNCLGQMASYRERGKGGTHHARLPLLPAGRDYC